MQDPSTLTKRQIRAIFARHRGAQAQLARELGVHRGTVGLWLRGLVKSERLDALIPQRAAELLRAEQRTK
jgi:transcriptional regulator with XRE-family HTH domain